MINHSNEKSIAQVLNEIKGELVSFITTRYELLAAEVNDKINTWKSALPMLAAAIILAGTAFVVATFGLVALVARLIGTDYAWLWGALVVFALYGAIAGVLGGMGYKRLTMQHLVPTRTLRVLKQDQEFFKDEARAA